MVSRYDVRWPGRLAADMQDKVLEPISDEALEEKRMLLLKRRDLALACCTLEIGLSLLCMPISEAEGSMIYFGFASALCLLSVVGLTGAAGLILQRIQIHGVVTSGLIMAFVMSFLMDALFSVNGVATGPFPAWLVCVVFLVPYSVNFACSMVSLSLGGALQDFLQLQELSVGLLSEQELEANLNQLAGQDKCCVCMDAPKNTAFIPCGHRCACAKCAENMRSVSRRCPVCRQDIQSAQRIFDT